MATVTDTLDTVERRARVDNYPFIVAFAFFLSVCCYLFFDDIAAARGQFTYALDDAYITFRLAKQFASTGVWGICPGKWVNCSSTPLFVLVLAFLFRVLQANIWVPLVLNLAGGSGCLYAADRLLTNAGCGPRVRTFALLVFCFVAPLPLLVFSGMEHVFQVLLALFFLNVALSVLADSSDARAFRRACWLAPLMVACRYEGLFIAGVVVGLLLLRRRFCHSLLLATSAGLPVVVLGVAGIAMGGYFLPNSLLLKASFPNWSSAGQIVYALGGRAVRFLIYNPYLAVPTGIAACLALFSERQSRWLFTKSQLLALIAVIVAFIHLQFAQVGWLFRYEAYVITLLVLGIVASANETLLLAKLKGLKSTPALVSCLIAMALLAQGGGLLIRATAGFFAVGYAARDVYQQQRQMAAFLARNYNGADVAANDVGAITFLSDIRVTDLAGLADADIMRLKVARHYTTDDIERIASSRGVRIAMVYDPWFRDDMWRPADEGGTLGGPALPSRWIKVGEWNFPDALYEGWHTVSFYGVNNSEADLLRTHLAEYAAVLPAPAVTRLTH